MKLKNFLERYRIIEKAEIIKESQLTFHCIDKNDTDLLNTIFDKSSTEYIQDYTTDENGTVYDVYVGTEEVKCDLSFKELEEFIEEL